MMTRVGWGLGAVGMLVSVVACKSSPATPADGELPEADASDAAVDAAPDAAVDAAPDAAPDAPSPSPRCLTAPTRLLDVAPRRIGTIARSGSTLYVSVYDPADPTGPGALVTIDLATNTQSGPEVVTPTVFFLASTDGNPDADVFATDRSADGSVWRLHPGSPPALLIAHRAFATAIAADDTNVYWAEHGTGVEPDQIFRRAIAGGSIDPVMTCDAYQLHVAEGYLYCSGFRGVTRHHTDGAGTTDGIAYPLDYPVYASMVDGGKYYFAPFTFTQKILRVDGASTTAVTVAPANVTRFGGLGASSDYFYAVDAGHSVRRVHRATGIEEMVYPYAADHDLANGAVLEWNNHLYFTAEDYNLSPPAPYLLHCID